MSRPTDRSSTPRLFRRILLFRFSMNRDLRTEIISCVLSRGDSARKIKFFSRVDFVGFEKLQREAPDFFAIIASFLIDSKASGFAQSQRQIRRPDNIPP